MKDKQIIWQLAAVVLGSALAVVLTNTFANEALSWGDRFGLGGFLAILGVVIVTTVECHRFQHAV